MTTEADDVRVLLDAVIAERDALRERLARVVATCYDEMMKDDLSQWGTHGRHFAAKRILDASSPPAATEGSAT